MVSEKKQDIRRKILDVTRALLVQHGITHLSIRMITREVGCSVGKIYFYFENKDALIHALIEEGFEKLVAAQEASDNPALTFQDRIATLCHTYVDFGLRNPEYYEIMFMLKPERMARYPAEKYRKARRSIEVFADVLREAHEKGTMVFEEPFLQAHLIWSFLHGIIGLVHVKRIDRKIEHQVMIDAAIRQIVDSHFEIARTV